MAGEVAKPHDHLFRSVFRDEAEAAGLLRANLPPVVTNEVIWSTLKRRDRSFVDGRLRGSESDLLFEARRKPDRAPAWLYVLLEHQSTPDHWLRLRLLKYSIRIWEEDREQRPDEEHLRPIVPLVLYQGRSGWTPAREFAELFAPDVRGWPAVPRYAHLLLDQTQARPEDLRGQLRGRTAQLAMMAAAQESWEVLRRLVPLLADLVRRTGEVDDLLPFVVYVASTTRGADRWNRFAEAVRRDVPGGGELMTDTRGMLEAYGEVVEQEALQKGRDEGRQEGRHEGRQEGRQEGILQTIEGFLGRNVPWSTIEAATGIDEAEFARLRQQLDSPVGGAAR